MNVAAMGSTLESGWLQGAKKNNNNTQPNSSNEQPVTGYRAVQLLLGACARFSAPASPHQERPKARERDAQELHVLKQAATKVGGGACTPGGQ